MALDYRKCAEEIAANIGGGSNVISAAHCATRLRLVIADNSKVNKKVLENVDGVKGLFESNGQLQLIIGGDCQRITMIPIYQIRRVSGDPSVICFRSSDVERVIEIGCSARQRIGAICLRCGNRDRI